jgi:hypothetical protein
MNPGKFDHGKTRSAFPEGPLMKSGGVIMNSIYRLLALPGALVAVLSATLCFAQEDHVTIKRTIGDFYDITISGERNGDFAKVQMVRTETHRWRYELNPMGGNGPALLVYALVASGGDTNARSSYSMTIKEELSGSPAWGISYYVTDSYMDFIQGNVGQVKTIFIWDYYPYDSHFNEGYHFNVDFTGSSIEPQPEGTLTIHNLKLEGFEDPLWATFQWNPGSLSLEFKEAGPEN